MATEPQGSGVASVQPSARSAAAWSLVVLGSSALLGLLGGLIWGEAAPRATLQEIGTGTAELVNAETRAYIGADVWFCGIAIVAGLLTGVLGYRFALSDRHGGARAAVAASLILGAVAGSLVTMWLGEQIGLSAYNQHLASSPNGTLFAASLVLGAKSALSFWPLFTSVVLLVAEWGNRGPVPRRAEPPQ